MGILDIISKVGSIALSAATSDAEKAQIAKIMANLEAKKAELQVEINKSELAHPSFFVAGARYSVIWVCSIGLLYQFLIQPLMCTFGLEAPSIDISSIHSLLIALIGFGGYRTIEKIKGVARNTLK